MADDKHRAETPEEVMRRALDCAAGGESPQALAPIATRLMAEALDRVRDARGDDETSDTVRERPIRHLPVNGPDDRQPNGPSTVAGRRAASAGGRLSGEGRVALNQTRCSGCTEVVRDEEPLRFRSGVLWHEACLAVREPLGRDARGDDEKPRRRWNGIEGRWEAARSAVGLPMSTSRRTLVMADDKHRAEIEAVAAEAREIASVVANDEKFNRIETLIDQLEDAALDRVRDARGDDEGCACGKTSKTCRLPPDLCVHPARSPQSEDHETGAREDE